MKKGATRPKPKTARESVFESKLTEIIPAANSNQNVSTNKIVKFSPFCFGLDDANEKILNLKLLGLYEAVEAHNQSSSSSTTVICNLLDEVTSAVKQPSDYGFVKNLNRFQGTNYITCCLHISFLIGCVLF